LAHDVARRRRNPRQGLRRSKFNEWTKEDQFNQREAVNGLVASHMVKRSIVDWETIFAKHGVWCARVNGYEEVLTDPQVAANQSILEFDHPEAGHVRALAHPVRYDGEAPALRRVPPSVGEHTGEVMRELGYESADIDSLRQSGAVGPDRAVTGFDRKSSAPASAYSRKSQASS
jgi:crotonobetainyl-CoA:carnitine CoA-transferase CaiB-like acyl-CoA transferase